MKVVKSVHELIEITSFPLPEGTRLFAKLEFLNPGGSVKDRLGMELIEDGFNQGLLSEGGTVIEPTAGNTGIGLAIAALRRNIHVMFVVPEKFSQEKQALMKALGATVVNTPTSEGMTGAIERAKKLVEEIPNSYMPLQFQNPANPKTYYKTLGPELVEQLEGKIDVFVAGAGSAGTFIGTAQYLKDNLTNVKTVIVEPEGSILNGGKPGPHDTEGIGMEFIPSFVDKSLMETIHTVSDDDAFRCVRELALKEGLLVGSSSGAAFYACLIEAENAKPGSTIVTIFPDSSDRYLSKNIYGER
jgi:O-acetylserine dependent cystathionine beta-synthase